MNTLYDTHAHLDMKQFDSDRKKVIERAKKDQVEIITVGIDHKSSEEAIKLADQYELYCAVGIHPHEAKRVTNLKRAISHLGKLALHKSGKVVAIGEIGLDYYRNYSPREDQKRLFEAQLKLAKELCLPVVVHNRQADNDVLTTLKKFNLAGVIHSFFGDLKLAKRFIEMGFYLGISGPITFPKAGHRKAVKQLPIQQIVLETDCPYLTLIPHRGKRNEPAYVKYVAQQLCKLKELNPEEVKQQTTENTEKLFSLH